MCRFTSCDIQVIKISFYDSQHVDAGCCIFVLVYLSSFTFYLSVKIRFVLIVPCLADVVSARVKLN